MTTALLVGVFAVLLLLGFWTKRRFGVVGLALAAGALLAQSSSDLLATYYASQHLHIGDVGHYALAIITLTIIPPLLMLMSGPQYASRKGALLGAFASAILGVTLIISALGNIPPDGSQQLNVIIDNIMGWQGVIIIAAIIGALLDVLLVNRIHHTAHKKSKH